MAEDAVQTAWMKFFPSMESFDPRIPLTAWAVMIVKRVCSNMRRGHLRCGELALDDSVDHGVEFVAPIPSPSESYVSRERLNGVLKAIEELPERD